jgi:hypothetical protein
MRMAYGHISAFPLIFMHQAIGTLANVAELLQSVNSERVPEVAPETWQTRIA